MGGWGMAPSREYGCFRVDPLFMWRGRGVGRVRLIGRAHQRTSMSDDNDNGDKRHGDEKQSILGMARELTATMGALTGRDPNTVREEFDRTMDSITREGVDGEDIEDDVRESVRRATSTSVSRTDPDREPPWPITAQATDGPGQLVVVDHPHDRVEAYQGENSVLVKSDVGEHTITFQNDVGSLYFVSDPGDEIAEIIVEPPRMEFEIESEATGSDDEGEDGEGDLPEFEEVVGDSDSEAEDESESEDDDVDEQDNE